jgi:hypothetical protein
MSDTSHHASMPAVMKANRSTASEQITTRLEARALERGESEAYEPLSGGRESGAAGRLRSRA